MMHIDFETRSEADLREVGPTEYARHPSTEILCMAYGWEGQSDVRLWRPGDPVPEVPDALVAHNAAFERALWGEVGVKRHRFPVVSDDAWRCTMAVAAYYGLPQSLDTLADLLQLKNRKDKDGHRLMMQLSTGKRQDSLFGQDCGKLQRLYEYCRQDVRTEMELSAKIGWLPIPELKVWQLDQRINARGLRIDRELCRSAIRIIEATLKDRDQRIQSLTGGTVTAVTEAAGIAKWASSRGVSTSSVAAGAVDTLLAKDDLPEDVREVLQIRRDSAMSSTAKFARMLERSGSDGRMRDNLRYHGGFTGRWAGTGAQIQNFPRGSISQVDTLAELITDGDAEMLRLFFGDEMECCKSALRSAITCDPDKRLLIWDYGQIEARALAWFAGEKELVRQFSKGDDIYREFAAQVWKKPAKEVSKQERFIGKTCILGLGYQMGATKFRATLAGYGTSVTEAFAKRCVDIYRSTYKRIVELWRDIERVAVESVSSRSALPVRSIKYDIRGSFLRCQLPSGRTIHYYQPRIADGQIEYQTIGQNGRMCKANTYGGKLTENTIQAIARDVLVSGMMALEQAGFPVVATIHDEIIVESEAATADERLHQGEKILATAPSWAADLPLSVEGFHSRRYRK